jgi:AhpC/TSA family
MGAYHRGLCRANAWKHEEKKEMLRDYRQPIAVTVLSAIMLFTPLSLAALQVGDKAPDFLLFSTMEESLRLSDYQGKKHVLLFFFVRAFGGV